jgi:uncharacterized protein
MSESDRTIALLDGRSVTGLWSGPETAEWTLVYAPGAGSDLRDPFGVFAARELAEHGIACLRFQFPYSEEKRRLPDRPPVLEATWEAAIDAARGRAQKLAIGGRSMGGRIASQVVAKGAAVDALALFAYPLHPPGRLDKMRDAHLPQISVPTLFCSGTNDTFGTPDELRVAASTVPESTLHVLEGADHGFQVPKRSGRTREEIWREVIQTFIDWLPPAAHKGPHPG